MVIVRPTGGLANQLDQYGVGRSLARKLNTELKLDVSYFENSPEYLKKGLHNRYRLGAFNIIENFATLEEIKYVKETGTIPNSAKDLENIQGNVYIVGNWLHNPQLFKDTIDILREEFTLKKPFSPTAETWRQKILSAECSVSMHFRHGDYLYANWHRGLAWAPILPLDYYYTCIDILKQRYNNLTVFVFSDNLPWVKENLHLDVPTEFIEGCETDDEDFILMSLCKHDVIASSTFSRLAAYLNPNSDKKVFGPLKSNAEGVKKFLCSLTPDRKNSILDAMGEDTNRWFWITYDFDNQAKVTLKPIFSLSLVVNDNAADLPATLKSLLNQDYEYYEVIIIDNDSTDGSDKICQETIKDKANVTYKRLDKKVSNAAAWNEAVKAVQGKYVSFLKVGDRFLTNSLTTLYALLGSRVREILHTISYLVENASGDVAFDNKKFSAQRDEHFKQAKQPEITSQDGLDAAQLLLNHQINSFFGTKLYNVEFLKEHKIKFDEQLDDKTAELAFQAEAFLKSKYLMYISKSFYIAPSQSNLSNEIISLEDQSIKNRPLLTYQTHVASKGWSEWLNEDQISNDTEQKRQIEAIKIYFPNHKVYYAVYWNDAEGWSKEVSFPEQAGTTGKSKPIMGIVIRLDEENSKEFDILYRVHKFDGTWTAWAKNGEFIYSHGQKLNAIQIKLATNSDKNSL